MNIFDTSYRTRKFPVGAWTRAGRPWSEDEEERLRQCFDAGYSLQSICERHSRAPVAIIARLATLKLIRATEPPCPYNNFRPDYIVNPKRSTSLQSQPETTEEETMNDKTCTDTAENIEHKTFIGGVDAARLSDEQIFERIARIEKQIADYDRIVNKPAKLKKVMDKLAADIDALGKYVDERV